MILHSLRDRRFLLETGFCVAILGGLVYAFWHILEYGYPPQPFFHHPDDTFNDWFNTAIWARDEGSYDAWGTIYPPLSFLFVRPLGFDVCYRQTTTVAARSCDWPGLVAIFAIFVINLALIYCALRKTDKRFAIQRTICVGIGFPMMSGIERGNLIFVAFAFFVLAFCPILKSARVRWIAAGIAVNFKLYLVGAIFAQLLKRRWRWAECAMIAAIATYLISYALLGRGTPWELVENIRIFNDVAASDIMQVWHSTTYQVLVSLLSGNDFPSLFLFGSDIVDNLIFYLPLTTRFTQTIIFLSVIAIWLRPEKIPNYRVINLAIFFTFVSSEAGGYSYIFFMIFVMMEPWKGFLRKFAIIACYVLAIPLDIRLNEIPGLVNDTYFGNSRSEIYYYVILGPFVRALVVQMIAVSLATLTITEVWQDIRQQGWSSRWRFRRDAPLLPWVKRPAPPVSA